MPAKKEQVEPGNSASCWKRQRGVEIVGNSSSTSSSSTKAEAGVKRSPAAYAAAAQAASLCDVKTQNKDITRERVNTKIVVDERRVRSLTPNISNPKAAGKCVVCFLQRDLRCYDNWALLKAQELALSLQQPLALVHLLVPFHTFYPTLRHYAFRIGGLVELQKDTNDNNITFVCAAAKGSSKQAAAEARDILRELLELLTPSAVVCDFMPLRDPRQLYEDLAKICSKESIPVYQVDAHNIIPVWVTSEKEQVAARTIRPLLLRHLPDFLTDYPAVAPHPYTLDIQEILKSKKMKKLNPGCFNKVISLEEAVDSPEICHKNIQLPKQWMPGSRQGLVLLKEFCTLDNLLKYENRNNPLLEGQSNLSPYLHFGQLSAQRCWLSVNALFHKSGPNSKVDNSANINSMSGSSDWGVVTLSSADVKPGQRSKFGKPTATKATDLGTNLEPSKTLNINKILPNSTISTKNASAVSAKDSFFNELVTWRELAENFVYYNRHYDSLSGALRWAQDTLNDHRSDKRTYLYTFEEFEAARTHDALWNAAQIQLVTEAKMHGFLRMYWAKKILEWTDTPENAIEYATKLNDKYSLDGTDPNGYAGCMWSICGVHDHGWTERPIFGKIRFMNYTGCCRKFDVNAFLKRYPQAVANARDAEDKHKGRK